MSFYDLLGVSDAATPEDIKKAYLVKARQCHPDVNPGVDEKAFKQVSQAYEVTLCLCRQHCCPAAATTSNQCLPLSTSLRTLFVEARHSETSAGEHSMMPPEAWVAETEWATHTTSLGPAALVQTRLKRRLRAGGRKLGQSKLHLAQIWSSAPVGL